MLICVNAHGSADGDKYVGSGYFEERAMRKVAMLAAFVAIAGGGVAAPTSAVAGCYRLGETGYHWYRSCWGPHWIYPHQRVCRRGHCWYR